MQDPTIKSVELCPDIIVFLKELSNLATAKGLRWFFLRGFEKLPKSCGVDLDMAVDPAKIEEFISLAEETAKTNKLVALKKFGTDKCWRIGVFSLRQRPCGRKWLFLDLKDSLDFGDFGTFSPVDIDLTTYENAGFSFPVPEQEWHFALFFMDTVKQNKLTLKSGRKEELQLLFNDLPPNASVFKKMLFSRDDSRDIIFSGKTGCRSVSEKPPALTRGIKRKFSEFVFRKLFFFHFHHPALFTVQGADGAGKTTVVKLVAETFKSYDAPVVFFHHVSESKHNIEAKPGASSGDAGIKQISLARKIIKVIWKFTPKVLKSIWSSIVNELEYASQINARIADAFFSGKIIILDRYSLDRYIKTRMAGIDSISRLVSSFFSFWIHRRPTKAFILTDDPEKIHKRKDELEEHEIAEYQKNMLKLCEKFKLEFDEVAVNSRLPEEIAQFVAEDILKVLGKDIFSYAGKILKMEN